MATQDQTSPSHWEPASQQGHESAPRHRGNSNPTDRLAMKSKRCALFALGLLTLTVSSMPAVAQPLGKTLNTGDRILRGSRDWSVEQARVAPLRPGGFEALTGQKVLASEKGGNIFFVTEKERAGSGKKQVVLGSGDIYGTALRNSQSSKTVTR